MEAFNIEQSILEGEKEVKELFDFVRTNAVDLEAYEMEIEIFLRLMKIGMCAMKPYFAEKGTGDKTACQGPERETFSQFRTLQERSDERNHQ